jgi:NTP pyrophosphatase (non-canonical NTP hydrolase)
LSATTNALDAYQRAACRTAPGPHDEKALAIYALGLAGEAGEVVELVKKHLGHGHQLDKDKLTRELGDVAWYLAVLAMSQGINLSEIAARNLAKLRERYPAGFSHEASQQRKAGDE